MPTNEQRSDLLVVGIGALGTFLGALAWAKLKPAEGKAANWTALAVPIAGFALASWYAPQQKTAAAVGALLPVVWF